MILSLQDEVFEFLIFQLFSYKRLFSNLLLLLYYFGGMGGGGGGGGGVREEVEKKKAKYFLVKFRLSWNGLFQHIQVSS